MFVQVDEINKINENILVQVDEINEINYRGRESDSNKTHK